MMEVIKNFKGITMSEGKLIVICVTLIALAGITSVAYYKTQESAMMSRNIENGIVKGIDPVAVRCAYANPSDNVCVAYAVSKQAHTVALDAKK